jgi:cytochrome c-type biogenesis protein CcmH
VKRAARKARATTHAAVEPVAQARDVPLWLVALILAVPLVLVLGYGSISALWPGETAASPHARGFGSGAAPTAARAPSSGSAPAAQGGAQSTVPPDIEESIARLAKRLESQPDDPKGWNTLAHSYYAMQRFEDAVVAYERLVKLAPPSADTLADYADALAMTQGRSLAGKPMELVRQALTLNPSHWKARSMAATEAFNRKDYSSAIEHWQKAREALAPDSDNARVIDNNIAEARQLAAGSK